MNALQTSTGKHIRNLLPVVGLLIVARALFIALMPQVHSKDLHAWLHVADVLQAGGNPYAETPVLNWPPFWMQAIFCISRLSAITGLSVTLLIQATLVAAEALTAVMCYCIIVRFFNLQSIKGVLIAGLALNPISVFLSCQHCNFDVIAGLWILLFTYSLLGYCEHGRTENWLAASFFLGMGVLTKTVPLILSPMLIVGIKRRNSSTTVFGALLLLAPVTIGMSIIYALAPAGVGEHVLGYRSMGGWYGITGLCNVLGIRGANEVYGSVAPALILCLMMLMAYRLRNKATLTPIQLIASILALLVFLPTFGPGYSPPYILWFMPLLPVYYLSAPAATKKLMLAGYVITALTYTTEYAFFESHGAFIKVFLPTGSMAQLCTQLGQSPSQTLIRLPMFLFFVVFYVQILRTSKATLISEH